MKSSDAVETFEENPNPLYQRYAMMVLFFATNGELWNGPPWTEETDIHECDFLGVDCDLDRVVIGLDMTRRQLRGRLPDELGTMLTNLRMLKLDQNSLEGSIPAPYFDGLSNLGTWILFGSFAESLPTSS